MSSNDRFSIRHPAYSSDYAKMVAARKAADFATFQCGDATHAVSRGSPNLEANARRKCTLPKMQKDQKNDKGQMVTTIVHRSVVTKAMVEDFHESVKEKWLATGHEFKPDQKTSSAAKALADRKELERDNWEVIDEADVDDTMEARGAFSHKKVRTLENGLQ